MVHPYTIKKIQEMLEEAEARDAASRDAESALNSEIVAVLNERITTKLAEQEVLMARVIELKKEIMDDQKELAKLVPSFATALKVGLVNTPKKSLFGDPLVLELLVPKTSFQKGIKTSVEETLLLTVKFTNYGVPVVVALPFIKSITFQDKEFITNRHYLCITDDGTRLTLKKTPDVATATSANKKFVNFSINNNTDLKRPIEILDCSVGEIEVKDISTFNHIRSFHWNELPSSFTCHYVKLDYNRGVLVYSNSDV